MRIRPFIGTLCGIGIGMLAIVIWMVTFEAHGGVEPSWCLFPLSPLVLKRLYPAQSIPAPLWFGSAVLQWIVIGAIVDFLRHVLRRGSR